MPRALNVHGADVRVALVGFGYWGGNLARNVAATPGLSLVGIVDPDVSARVRAAELHPESALMSDLRELEECDDVDAAIVATPPATHATIASRLLHANLHLLVEKPLSMDVAETDALVELARDRSRVLMVGHTFLYSAPVRRIRELVASGEIGDVEYLYAQRLSLGRIRRDCNVLWNLGPHDVSILEFLIGAQPYEVSASGHAFIGPPLEDVFFATLRYPNGQVANLHLSWIHPLKVRMMTVVGAEKMIVYDDVSVDAKLRIYDSGVARSSGAGLGGYESLGDFQWRTRAGDVVMPRIELHEPLGAEMQAFAEACCGGPKPLTDAAHGARVVKVLAAIEASARAGGRPVDVLT